MARHMRVGHLPDHPRIRGEHADLAGRRRLGEGSSPHTRGARQLAGDSDEVARIIPAYAGSTKPIHWMGRQWPDHPRIRGEHLRGGAAVIGAVGSSPHTRGARLYGEPLQIARGIIPAYAGSTACCSR